jgi:hypothetical protein
MLIWSWETQTLSCRGDYSGGLAFNDCPGWNGWSKQFAESGGGMQRFAGGPGCEKGDWGRLHQGVYWVNVGVNGSAFLYLSHDRGVANLKSRTSIVSPVTTLRAADGSSFSPPVSRIVPDGDPTVLFIRGPEFGQLFARADSKDFPFIKLQVKERSR